MLLASIIDPIIQRALTEDLSGGDLSAEACIPADTMARAVAIAKSPLVVAGGVVFKRVFDLLGEGSVEFEQVREDGAYLKGEREPIWRIQGPARVLLMGERTALNLVQRMSGTATLARACAWAVPEGCATRITDTRKTTPGLRYLERYAVRVGGAHNHRNDLGSAVMIKDNHIVAAGGVTRAIERARARAPHTTRIEVEVASLVELDEALAARADIIMLDNFSIEDVREARARAKAKGEAVARSPLLEVSGGITLERIGELAAAGIDVISVGALTHSAKAADIALDLRL